MKTNIEAAGIVWKVLNEHLSGLITGGVYKFNRPFDSVDEDIVLTALPITTNHLQECVVNVNCYAPNLKVKIKGKVDDTIADSVRLAELTQLVFDHAHDVSLEGCYFYVSGQAILANEAGDEHYSNIRLTFLFVGSQ